MLKPFSVPESSMRYADALDIEQETANVASMLMLLRFPSGNVPHSVENGEAVAAMVTIPAHAASSSICLFELFDALA